MLVHLSRNAFSPVPVVTPAFFFVRGIADVTKWWGGCKHICLRCSHTSSSPSFALLPALSLLHQCLSAWLFLFTEPCSSSLLSSSYWLAKPHSSSLSLSLSLIPLPILPQPLLFQWHRIHVSIPRDLHALYPPCIAVSAVIFVCFAQPLVFILLIVSFCSDCSEMWPLKTIS